MNILYCGDNKILDGLIISILSLAKQTKNVLKIFILTMDFDGFEALSEKAVEELEKVLKAKNPKHSIRLLNITDIFESNLPYANLSTFFTPYCLLRLYSDLVEELPNKILYLDTDVVALGDPNELYKMDVSEHELTGVVDYYGQHWIRTNLFEKNYMNSGVMLMNLGMIRENRVFHRARRYISHAKMLLPDQTALNIFAKHKKLVDRKYNEQHQETDETIFRHFSTTFKFWPVFHTQKIKPWNIDKLHSVLGCHAFDDIIDEYLEVKDRVKR